MYSIPAIRNQGEIHELPEKFIVRRWLSLESGNHLRDTDGNSIIIINPGQLNTYDGPDIQNVLVYYKGAFLQGDIECHSSSAGWFQHGHEHNHAYDSVIMHVVGHCSPGGRRPQLPHIILRPYENTSDCLVEQTSILSGALEKAIFPLANQRWKSFMAKYKSHNSLGFLLDTSCRYFGTKGNEQGFRLLWNEIDPKLFMSMAENERTDYVRALSGTITFEWRSAGIRPLARYEKRLPQFVTFITLVYSFDWQNDAIDAIAKAIKKELPQGLATELLGNCILPFYGARVLTANKINILSETKNIWDSLTLPYSYGKINRQFQYCIPNRQLKKFRIIQGLIELQNRYCKHSLCQPCSLIT